VTVRTQWVALPGCWRHTRKVASSGRQPEPTSPFPEQLLEQARAAPGGWLSRYRPGVRAPRPGRPSPTHAIKGAWKVGADGIQTGEFEASSTTRAERPVCPAYGRLAPLVRMHRGPERLGRPVGQSSSCQRRCVPPPPARQPVAGQVARLPGRWPCSSSDCSFSCTASESRS